jgi:hypothetical protein
MDTEKGKKGVAEKKILCFISFDSLGYKLGMTFFNILCITWGFVQLAGAYILEWP